MQDFKTVGVFFLYVELEVDNTWTSCSHTEL